MAKTPTSKKSSRSSTSKKKSSKAQKSTVSGQEAKKAKASTKGASGAKKTAAAGKAPAKQSQARRTAAATGKQSAKDTGKTRSRPAAKKQPPAGKAAKTCVFVLGFHRSGTSALMRSLNLIGVPLPESLLRPNADNPDGFFESDKVRLWHDQAMEAVGVNWFDMRPFPPDWQESPAMVKLHRRISTMLEAEFEQRTLLGLKDPRMCRLFPVWFRACEELSIQPKVVLALRKPLESAMSLVKRNKLAKKRARMGLPQALLLWLRYMCEAEQATRDLPRAITSFDELLTEPDACVNRIAETLDLDLPDAAQKQGGEKVREFVQEGKRHQKLSETGPPQQHPPLLQIARQFYLAGAQGSDDFGKISVNLRRRLDQGWALYGPLMTGFDQGQLQSLTGKPVVKH